MIDSQSLETIAKVINFAKKNPVTRKQLTEKSIVVGNITDYVCKIPDACRVVFSFEDQPTGWCRHLSVSIPDKTKLPNPPAVEMIIKEFGFTGTITDQTNVWIETEVVPHAINVIQIVDDEDLCEELNEAIKNLSNQTR